MPAIVDQALEQMNKSIEATKENFMGIRTGRANPALLNGIMVDYYGAPTPIKAVAFSTAFACDASKGVTERVLGSGTPIEATALIGVGAP